MVGADLIERLPVDVKPATACGALAMNAAIVTDQNQATNNTYMAGFFQSDIAQLLFDSNGQKFKEK